MAIIFLDTTDGPVDLTTLPVPPAPTGATTDYGTCDCGTEMSPLIDNDGRVRTTFCEYCN